MSDLVRLRRDPVAVVGRALAVGAVTAVPLAAVSLVALSILQSLAGGATWGLAWAAVGWTDEDLEMVPGVVFGAVLLAGLAAVVAAGAWLLVMRLLGGQDGEPGGRELRRAWVARGAGAVAAFAAPMMLLVVPNWPLALAAALPAGVVALVAEPRVAYEPANEEAVVVV